MSIINGGSVLGFLGGAAAGYEISRSLRFNSADSAYLNRTPASAGNRKTWTWAGWVKRCVLSGTPKFFGAGTGSNDRTDIGFDTNRFQIYDIAGSSERINLQTTAVFRDPSAWYHFVVAVDTTQATSTNRAKVYVNGTQQTSLQTATYPSQNTDLFVNATNAHYLGRGAVEYENCYLADIHFIDGQALDPTSFGEFDANGIWQPKSYTGTYGTNGFHLDFSDNSAATAAALGADSSGNGNNWTPNNLSVTAGAGNDSLVDVPTNGSETDTGVGGEVVGNYATLNPLDNGGLTLANGNLDVSTSSTGWKQCRSTLSIPETGKWYAEFLIGALANNIYTIVGLSPSTLSLATYPGGGSNSISFQTNGQVFVNNSSSAIGTTFVANDIMQIAVDRSSGKVWLGKNNTWVGSGDPANGTNPISSSVLTTGVLQFAIGLYTSANSVVANFGQRPFAYTAPSGFKALCTANLPAPTIVKPSTVMDVVTYTGTGSTLTPTSSLGFNPDLVWIKSRSAATDHALYDSVRGAQARLESNTTDAEVTSDSGVTAFNTAGFTLGTLAQVNTNAATYAAWTWDAGSSTVTNTAGSITSSVRANASAGFSIVTYTGTNVASESVGHGLGVKPAFILYKRRNGTSVGIVWHSALAANEYLGISLTANANNYGSDLTPADASTFKANTAGSAAYNTNVLNATYVAYCFAPVAGYSAFGSYTGNGSADGPMVFTNMRPRWIMIKRTDSTFNWLIYDAVRNTYNLTDLWLVPNLSSAEASGGSSDSVDLVSNGFKIRGTGAALNASGGNYIYACFAESPFSLARAR